MERVTVAMVLLLAACGNGPAGGRPRFVATTPPLAAILREVTGDRVDVLLPPGASPHAYEPRPTDVRAASQTMALFYTAATLDAWGAALPAPRRIEVLRMVPDSLLRYGYADARVADDDGSPGFGQAGAPDPHFWLDPLVVRALVPALADTLSALDPGGAAVYHENARHFAAQLDSLNHEVAALLAPVRGRRAVLLHPSFGYMLSRYGIEVVAVLEPSAGREPTARGVATIAERIRRTGAVAVFSEPQLPPNVPRLVAEMAGVRLAELDPLGGQPGRQRYADLIRYDARVLRETLQ